MGLFFKNHMIPLPHFDKRLGDALIPFMSARFLATTRMRCAKLAQRRRVDRRFIAISSANDGLGGHFDQADTWEPNHCAHARLDDCSMGRHSRQSAEHIARRPSF